MTTTTDVAAIPAIDHGEAMALAATEADRLVALVTRLPAPAWSLPTDCAGWDVRALVSHVLGSMESSASLRELVRQSILAARAARRSGRPVVDEMTARHVRDHASMAPAQLAARVAELAPRAVRGRSRTPAVLRAARFRPGAPFEGTWRIGYLVDVILTRDSWMHRVDLSRATAADLQLTAEHDGRIVADVVAEWARAHGQPFVLVLDGPAGGAFVSGRGGVELHLDAVELCRILSGRAPGSGLLAHQVPF